MDNIVLSGGNYGGFIFDGKVAKNINPDGESTEMPATIDGNIINVDGWLYDTSISTSENTADYIGMAQ